MEELRVKLYAVPNAYFGFVAGIMNYAKQKPERLQNVLQFLDSSDDLSTSKVIEFVMMQPDFHEFGVSLKELAS